MNTPRYKISLGFVYATDTNFGNFATTVKDKAFQESVLPPPPVTLLGFTANLNDFLAAKAAQPFGGKTGTALKNQKRKVVENDLRLLAAWVQQNANNDLVTILATGFEVNSTNRAKEVLPAPVVKSIRNGQSGQTLSTLDPVKNAGCYEQQTALLDDAGTPGVWVEYAPTTGGRNIPANGLLPGRMYIFRFRAIGGLSGSSDWSEVMSHRAY